jgi:hypothetical protein
MQSSTNFSEQRETVQVDAVFIAQQFERINVTMEFFGKALENQVAKETAQDVVIGKLQQDVTEIKGDIKAIRDSKLPKVSGWTISLGIVAAAGFGLGLLNQLYGG